MNQLYEQLGELYYNAHSDDPEQDFPEIVGNITDLQDQIDDLNDQIQQLKGYVKCPNCGAVITDQDVMFCQYCGARLDRQSEQEQTVIQEPGLIRCKCGAILEKDDMFCSKCGTSREELEKLQNGYTEE